MNHFFFHAENLLMHNDSESMTTVTYNILQRVKEQEKEQRLVQKLNPTNKARRDFFEE